MIPEFLVTTERHGSSMLLGCSGELDLATCDRLDEVFAIALGDNPQHLIFDGTGISLLSSPGIEKLLELVRCCEQRGIRLEMKFNDHAKRMLYAAGLSWLEAYFTAAESLEMGQEWIVAQSVNEIFIDADVNHPVPYPDQDQAQKTSRREGAQETRP